jgi:indole-3-glycerol phosphate synthase
MSQTAERKRNVPVDHRRRLAASRTELQQLTGPALSEITPSRRDFAQYVTTQKDELAVIALLAIGNAPQATATVLAHAQACDDADVEALAVAAGAGGLSMDDMAAIAAATTAPILRDALIINPRQLYAARLYGADAALFPAADIERSALHELVTIAASLHMAAIVEVLTAADIEVALQLPHVLLGIDCRTADGALDVVRTQQLAQRVPREQTVIVVPEISSPAESAALRGRCDAVMVGEVLQTDDVGAVLREIRTAGC